MFIGAIMLIAFSTLPLFATEVITIDQEEPTLGYVLNEGDGRVTVLLWDDRDRVVRTVAEANVRHEICVQNQPWILRRLNAISPEESPYPECPKQ